MSEQTKQISYQKAFEKICGDLKLPHAKSANIIAERMKHHGYFRNKMKQLYKATIEAFHIMQDRGSVSNEVDRDVSRYIDIAELLDIDSKAKHRLLVGSGQHTPPNGMLNKISNMRGKQLSVLMKGYRMPKDESVPDVVRARQLMKLNMSINTQYNSWMRRRGVQDTTNKSNISLYTLRRMELWHDGFKEGEMPVGSYEEYLVRSEEGTMIDMTAITNEINKRIEIHTQNQLKSKGTPV